MTVLASAGLHGGVNNLSEWSDLDPSTRLMEMEPSPGANFKMCYWKTQDRRMTKWCRRMWIPGLAGDFFVILASSVFQPSFCVRSLLKTKYSCLYSRQTRFSFDVPTYRLRLKFTATTALTFETKQDARTLSGRDGLSNTEEVYVSVTTRNTMKISSRHQTEPWWWSRVKRRTADIIGWGLSKSFNLGKLGKGWCC